jgi:hypothetical protein
LGGDLIGNEELLGYAPGATGDDRFGDGRGKPLMLGIGKSGSRTISLNNLFASVFSDKPRTVCGRKGSIGGNEANRIAGRVCRIGKKEIFETF